MELKVLTTKMEHSRKTDSVISKKQIASLHERVQSKYEEMQKKLEKSRSIDMLTSLSEDFIFKDQKRFMSVNDLSEIQKSEYKNNASLQEINLEEMQTKKFTFQDVLCKEAIIVESETAHVKNLKEYKESNEIFFEKNFFKTSLESLNEAEKESDDSIEPITPPHNSIRNKIGSRLKRRRGKEKERKKETRDKVEKYILSNTTKIDMIKVLKKIKIATTTVALIEVKGLEETTEERPRSLLLRLRKVIDLLDYEKEKTHKLWIKLDCDLLNIECLILLTITGTALLNTLYDVDSDKKAKKEYILTKKYAWYRLHDQFSDVGFLYVIVYGAKGLSSHDCYCVLNLNNERIQTQTDYKTNEPSWMKIISFKVTDITSILKIIVYDEKKYEEVGKLLIPLLKMKPGKKWYALKDTTLKERAKGNDARILLEFNVTWNLVKAAIRVINPKEQDFLETDEKLDRHVFARNLSRAKAVTNWIIDAFKFFKTCFEWESMKLNVVALIMWITFCYFVQVWMLPLLFLLPFFWYKPKEYTLIDWKKRVIREISLESNLDSKSDKDDKSVTLRQKINSLQEIIQSIQNIIGRIASTGESIKNLFNFTVPFVSFLAILFLMVIAFIMFLIPFKYICIIWGVHKFLKKILRPNRIPNNEILDLLSRVPDDELLVECEQIPLRNLSENDDC